MNDLSIKNFLLKGSCAGEKLILNIPRGRFDGSIGAKTGYSAGNSLEFMEHRDYFPGDDLRMIDWDVYARTDRLAVKIFHDEVTPALDIVIDTSNSMNLDNSAKSGAAAGMAALLATAAINSSFSFKTWLCGENGFEMLENGNETPVIWSSFPFKGSFSPIEMLEHHIPPFSRHGLRIFISDLLFPADPKLFFSRFSAGASSVIILQVLAFEDIYPSLKGNVMLTDSETGEKLEIFADPALLKEYSSKLEAHRQAWLRTSNEYGAFFSTVIAEDFSKKWLGIEAFAFESFHNQNSNSIPECVVEELIKKEILRIL